MLHTSAPLEAQNVMKNHRNVNNWNVCKNYCRKFLSKQSRFFLPILIKILKNFTKPDHQTEFVEIPYRTSKPAAFLKFDSLNIRTSKFEPIEGSPQILEAAVGGEYRTPGAVPGVPLAPACVPACASSGAAERR